jgi:hypothetical protein
MFDDEHLVSSVLRELTCLRRNARRSKQDRVHFTAISERSRGGECFECRTANVTAA